MRKTAVLKMSGQKNVCSFFHQKPVLICSQNVAVIKSGKEKHGYKTKHSSFMQSYPLKSKGEGEEAEGTQNNQAASPV